MFYESVACNLHTLTVVPTLCCKSESQRLTSHKISVWISVHTEQTWLDNWFQIKVIFKVWLMAHVSSPG